MTEDLQHLLEKIQKDGIDQAEKTASDILEKARHEAKELVAKAESDAARILEKAKHDAESFAENGSKSLEQAARNTIISTKAGIQDAVESVLSQETANAMDDGTMSEILIKIVDAYCADSRASNILVNGKDLDKFKDYILNKVSEKAREGLEVMTDDSISKGFRVVIKDKNLEYDLTDESLREALSKVLRPEIAAIMNKA